PGVVRFRPGEKALERLVESVSVGGILGRAVPQLETVFPPQPGQLAGIAGPGGPDPDTVFRSHGGSVDCGRPAARKGDRMQEQQTAQAMPVTTAFDFPGWETQRTLGTCFGLIVRSMGFAKGIGAGFKALAGGEVQQYTQLLEDSRRHAMDRMIE